MRSPALHLGSIHTVDIVRCACLQRISRNEGNSCRLLLVVLLVAVHAAHCTLAAQHGRQYASIPGAPGGILAVANSGDEDADEDEADRYEGMKAMAAAGEHMWRDANAGGMKWGENTSARMYCPLT